MASRKSTPFFMTQHAPVGAWASFNFGSPGKGAGLAQCSNTMNQDMDLLVACSRGTGTTRVLPFCSGFSEQDLETRQMEASRKTRDLPNTVQARWKSTGTGQLRRTLTPAVDEYAWKDLTFRVYTSHPSLPDPDAGGDLHYATAPGLLMEAEFDNTKSEKRACVFIGFANVPRRGLSPLDWLTGGALCGAAGRDGWVLGARTVQGRVFTVAAGGVAKYVDECLPAAQMAGEAGIALAVPPGQKGRLTAAFAFHYDGTVTRNVETDFWYKRYFRDASGVCAYLLENADRIRKECRAFDRQTEKLCPDQDKRTLFAQTVRAYAANTLLLNRRGRPLYAVTEGAFTWLNTMDLAVDHLGWELWRNPWVVRNIMDQFITRYTYRDRVKFDHAPGKTFPGGVSFTHDMGNNVMFSPRGRSGYEKPHLAGCYSFMTTEELLNGAYLLTSYALAARDGAWLKKRLSAAAAIVTSLENRDHHDPGSRDGILKADSMMCGHDGREITSYDNVDPSLMRARGNIYIAFKTWGALLMLQQFLARGGRTGDAARARAMADKCAATLIRSFDHARGCFPANVCEDIPGLVSAAIEPLAVPLYCGLAEQMKTYRELLPLVERHVRTCMKKGNCREPETGALLITSINKKSWASKNLLTLYVMEELFGIDLQKRCPSFLREVIRWEQDTGAVLGVVDTVNAATGTPVSAFYYPRIVTSAFLVKKRLHPAGL